MSTAADRSGTLQKVRRTLRKDYPRQTAPVYEDVARAILDFVLVEETDRKAAAEAMKRIDESFVDLNEVRVSFSGEIAESMPGVAHAGRKAARVVRIFNAMFLKHNTMNWDFLRNYGVRELRQYFEKIDGGDPVLAAGLVMLLSPGHAMPADADVRRVLNRLGLSEASEDVAELQGFLERAIKKEEGYETWSLLHCLAETVCLPGEPQCAKCSLKSTCPTGIERLSRPAKKAAAKKPKAKAKAAAKTKKAAASKTAKRSASKKTAKKAAKKAPKTTAKKKVARKTASRKVSARPAKGKTSSRKR